MAVAGLGGLPQITSTAAPAGIGSRQSAWEGSKPKYAKPSLTPGLEPLTQGDVLGYQFVTNKGNPAGVAGKAAKTKGAMGIENPTGFVPIVPGATYRIRNEKGKDQIVYSGIGAEGLSEVYKIAQQLSAQKGKKANWGVEMQMPGEEGWRRVADDDPAKGIGKTLGKIVGTALPLAVSLIPGLQFAGPVLSSALAGGAGAALAGRDPLKGAVLGGLTAAGGQLAKPISAATGLGTAAASAIGTGIGATAGGLATGQNLKNALVGGITSGGLSYLGGELMKPGAGSQGTAVTGGADGAVSGIGGFDGITVVGRALGPIINAAPLTNLLTPQQISDQVRQEVPEAVGTEDIEVRAQRAANEIMNGAGGLQLNAAGYTDAEIARAYEIADELAITAEGQRPVTQPSVPVAGIGGDIPEAIGTEDIIVSKRPDQPIVLPVTPGSGMPAGGNQPTTTEPKKGMGTSDYIRLGLLGLSALGGAGGGGGGGALPGSGGPLDYTPLNRRPTTGIGGAGTEPAFDVFTYGQDLPEAQRGEFQFFQPYNLGTATAAPETPAAIPQNAIAGFNTYQDTLASQVAAGSITPAAAQQAAMDYAAGLGFTAGAPALAEGGEVNDDMVKHLVAYSQGSGHQGPGKVSGIGSGQEDLIPAWLSDGEYVWSAQDVADLGDGSTDEGVRRLDKMRQMVRKNAGRKEVKKIAKPQPGMDKMLKAVGGPV